MLGASAAPSRRGLSVFSLFTLCLITAAAPARAAEVVELGFLADTRDASLEDLLYFAIGIELSRAGFSSSRTAGSGLLHLTAEYRQDGTSVQLSLTLAKAGGAASSAVVEAEVPMDDSFEGAVEQRVRDLLSAAGLLNPVSGTPGSEATMEGVLPQRAEASRAPLPTVVLMYAQTFVSGASLLGKLAELARYGVGAGLGGGLLWLADSWSLRSGLRLGTLRVLNNTGVDGGPLYLTSVAVEADWGTGRLSPYRLSAGGSVGALVLTVAGDGVRSKTVPFVDADAAVSTPLGGGFSLGTELRFQVAFETTLILDVSPALFVSKEF